MRCYTTHTFIVCRCDERGHPSRGRLITRTATIRSPSTYAWASSGASSSATPHLEPLEGVREDIYYPADSNIGVKLRNGKGALEIKVCRQRDERSKVEEWDKEYLDAQKYVLRDGGAVDVRALADALRTSASRFIGLPPVIVRKERQKFNGGEMVRVHLRTTRQSGSVLEESYRSISFESKQTELIARIDRGGDLKREAIEWFRAAHSRPAARGGNEDWHEGGIVMGYPELVASFAARSFESYPSSE